jgi:hypothetical protein
VAEGQHAVPDKTQLAAVAWDAAAQGVEKSFNRQVQQADTVAKLRLEFFDRIVLLNGGTVALSVTLVGALISRSLPLKSLSLLVASWIAFLLSMASALVRNWLEHDRLSALESNNYVIALNQYVGAMNNFAETLSGSLPEPDQAHIKKTVSDGISLIANQTKKGESLVWWTKLTGAFSLGMSVLAFILLLLFATCNIPTRQSSPSSGYDRYDSTI